jgi:hypothetical protein
VANTGLRIKKLTMKPFPETTADHCDDRGLQVFRLNPRSSAQIRGKNLDSYDCGTTGMPSASICTLLTMIRSPGWSPLKTT